MQPSSNKVHPNRSVIQRKTIQPHEQTNQTKIGHKHIFISATSHQFPVSSASRHAYVWRWFIFIPDTKVTKTANPWCPVQVLSIRRSPRQIDPHDCFQHRFYTAWPSWQLGFEPGTSHMVGNSTTAKTPGRPPNPSFHPVKKEKVGVR